MSKTIIIAWTETVMVPDGRPYKVDLGYLPTMKEVKEAKAVCWLLEGDDSDVKKAEAHAKNMSSTGRVFTFPTNHEDPMGEAKRLILR